MGKKKKRQRRPPPPRTYAGAGFDPNGLCFTCGKKVGKKSHFCPGDDSKLVQTLLHNIHTAKAMRTVLRKHLNMLEMRAQY